MTESAPITGATRLLAIVGDPIAQVRSPAVWNALFRLNGMDAVCVPFHVRPPEFGEFMKGLRGAANLIGLIVTIPHKIAAAARADTLTARAKLAGTANMLRPIEDGRWEGDILDGVGFVRALHGDKKTVAGRKTLVVGAGGVGSAIAFALADAGAASVDISDIDDERAAGLAGRIRIGAGIPSAVATPKAAGYSLVVNASPIGMRASDPSPIDLTDIQPTAIVGDVIISQQLTPILRDAQERGCHIQRGAAMTDYQLAAMARFLGFETGDWSPEAVAKAMAT